MNMECRMLNIELAEFRVAKFGFSVFVNGMKQFIPQIGKDLSGNLPARFWREGVVSDFNFLNMDGKRSDLKISRKVRP